MKTPIKSYKLAEFTIDLVKKDLYHSENKLKISDKEFDVLLCLIRNRPQTLSHDKIIKDVWNGTAVENSSVEKAIANIRKILGDKAKNPIFIKTIYNEGYRFIGDIDEISELFRNIESAKTAVHIDEPIEKKAPKTKFAFLGIVFLVLFFISSLAWLQGESIWTRMTAEVIFADDFSAKEVNLQKWNIKGKSVKVVDGIIKITVDEDDNWGWITSSYFDFDPNKTLNIKSRLKVNYSRYLKDKVYFVGDFGIVPINNLPKTQATDDRNTHFYGIKYTNYDSEYIHEDNPKTKNVDETLTGMKTEGFFLVRKGGRPHNEEYYRRGTVGPRIEPIWDEWFEQKIVYEPKTEKMIYFVDGEKRGEFVVGKLPLDTGENKIRLEILPWGWYLHHSIEIDYIEITQ